MSINSRSLRNDQNLRTRVLVSLIAAAAAALSLPAAASAIPLGLPLAPAASPSSINLPGSCGLGCTSYATTRLEASPFGCSMYTISSNGELPECGDLVTENVYVRTSSYLLSWGQNQGYIPSLSRVWIVCQNPHGSLYDGSTVWDQIKYSNPAKPTGHSYTGWISDIYSWETAWDAPTKGIPSCPTE